MKYKYAVVNLIMTPVETTDGLDNGWNEREKRFGVIVPIETVKAIDFNKIMSEFLDSSAETQENTECQVKK